MDVLLQPLPLDVRSVGQDHIKVSCPLFEIPRLPLSGLSLIPSLFAGRAGKVNISVDMRSSRKSKEVRDFLISMIGMSTDFYVYSVPLYKGFENFYINTNSSLLEAGHLEMVDGLFERFKGRSVIFCGAGPSLSACRKELELICKSGSTDVIAGGSALRVFCEWDIKPSFGLVADPWPTEWSHVFQHLRPEWIAGQTLIASASTCPRCLKYWKDSGGKVIFAGGHGALQMFSYLHSPFQTISIGLTVSTFMADLAIKAEVKELVLAGVDMCFSEDGGQYADGEALEMLEGQRVEVEGVSTRPAWRNEANLLGSMLANISASRVVPRGVTLLPLECNTLRPRELEKYIDGPNPPASDLTLLTAEQVYENAEVWLEKLRYQQDGPKMESPGYEGFLMPYERLQFAKKVRGEHFNEDLLKLVVSTHQSMLTELLRSCEIVCDTDT